MVQPTIYKPSIYNGNGVYNNGGGGGGGSIVLPDNIKLLSSLVHLNDSPRTGIEVNIEIKGDDIIDLVLYPCFGTGLNNSNSRFFEFTNAKKSLEIKTSSAYSDGLQIVYKNGGMTGTASPSNAYSQYGFHVKLYKDKFVWNGYNVNLTGTFTDYTDNLIRFWAKSTSGVEPLPFIRMIVYDKDENKKYDYLPAKNINDDSVGVWEKINGVYISTPNLKAGSSTIND